MFYNAIEWLALVRFDVDFVKMEQFPIRIRAMWFEMLLFILIGHNKTLLLCR